MAKYLQCTWYPLIFFQIWIYEKLFVDMLSVSLSILSVDVDLGRNTTSISAIFRGTLISCASPKARIE